MREGMWAEQVWLCGPYVVFALRLLRRDYYEDPEHAKDLGDVDVGKYLASESGGGRGTGGRKEIIRGERRREGEGRREEGASVMRLREIPRRCLLCVGDEGEQYGMGPE